MKNFIKNNFKFIFTIVWFTWLLIAIDKSTTFKNGFIQGDINHNHKMLSFEFDDLKNKIDSFEKKIITEFGYSRALGRVRFEELIDCMNYHAGCLDDEIEKKQKERHAESLCKESQTN